jgi:antitoxin component YwqK of YwqJK toxin-antitoxin module
MKYAKLIVIMVIFSCSEKNKNLEIGYFSEGGIHYIHKYKYGKLDGESVWFYPNGNIEQIVPFKNGVANGLAHYFYESGALKSYRFWLDDKEHGVGGDYYDTKMMTFEDIYIFKNGVMKYHKQLSEDGRVLLIEGSKEPLGNY